MRKWTWNKKVLFVTQWWISLHCWTLWSPTCFITINVWQASQREILLWNFTQSYYHIPCCRDSRCLIIAADSFQRPDGDKRFCPSSQYSLLLADLIGSRYLLYGYSAAGAHESHTQMLSGRDHEVIQSAINASERVQDDMIHCKVCVCKHEQAEREYLIWCPCWQGIIINGICFYFAWMMMYYTSHSCLLLLIMWFINGQFAWSEAEINFQHCMCLQILSLFSKQTMAT